MMALSRKKADQVFHVRAHAQKATCLDVGDTGGVLVTGGQDRKVNLWAFGSDECFMTLNGHNGTVDCVKFAHNDNLVYSSDDIGIIKQWDMNADSQATFHGHMKSVRTLDVHPKPHTPLFVSGSNDTTIRLWDMNRSSESLAKYRAHLSNVNQVQFSPDGNWIASAGAEGTVLIWDLRMSAQMEEFPDSTSAISCIQFHPSEYLVAAGRTNGTVDIFDLDANKLLRRIKLPTGTVKCCLFNEHGEWLFVGTDNGVSIVHWETDREVDFIEASWTKLFSMKVVNNKLMCASLDGAQVFVHSFNVNMIGRAFPVPAVRQPISAFQSGGLQQMGNMSGSGSARSFLFSQQKERGKDHFRQLTTSGGGEVATHHQGTDEDSGSPSSNLSMEMILADDGDETLTHGRLNGMADEDSDTIEFAYPDNRTNFDILKGGGGVVGGGRTTGGNAYESWKGDTDDANNSLSVASSSSPSYDDTNLGFQLSATRNVEFQRGHQEYGDRMGVNSPTRKDLERFDRHTDDFLNNSQFFNSANSDLGYRSDTGGDCVPRDRSTAEDFPVNNAPPPNYAPKAPVTGTATRISRQKTSIGFAQSRPQIGGGGVSTGNGRLTQEKRMGSLSVTNLADLRDGGNGNGRDGKFRTKNGVRTQNANRFRAGGSPVRNKLRNDFNANMNNNKENNAKNKNSNPDVKFYIKPPTRSRSTFDMRSAGVMTARDPGPVRREIPVPTTRQPRHSSHYESSYVSSDTQEINNITSGHGRVYQELCNRHATLKMNKDVAIMQDILVAIRQIARVDNGSLVDILGAVLEKSNALTLDMAIVVLPELYELLQSDRKFHCTRACDTLRVILTNFLPLIKQNTSSWAAHSLGVDISSEERWKKCNECRKWLLMIRSIPDNRHLSNALTQLQNLIVDL